MIEQATKDAFWKVVDDCLVKLYGLSSTEAHKKTACMRRQIEAPPVGMSTDIFYHAEPFDVAGELADGRRLKRANYETAYQRILEAHKW